MPKANASGASADFGEVEVRGGQVGTSARQAVTDIGSGASVEKSALLSSTEGEDTSQSPSLSISGNVDDHEDNPVAGFLVTAAPIERGVGKDRTVRTNEEGKFTFSNLFKGEYLVTDLFCITVAGVLAISMQLIRASSCRSMMRVR